jgi:hypothetical protein
LDFEWWLPLFDGPGLSALEKAFSGDGCNNSSAQRTFCQNCPDQSKKEINGHSAACLLWLSGSVTGTQRGGNLTANPFGKSATLQLKTPEGHLDSSDTFHWTFS